MVGVKDLIRSDVCELNAYEVANVEQMVKLDAMESPYGWSDSLVEGWCKKVRGIDFNRYPDPSARSLVALVKDVFEVPGSIDVLLGNGSDEIIQMLMLAMRGVGKSCLVPQPSFSMFKLIAKIVDFDCIEVDLRDVDFALDEERILQVVRERQPTVIFIAYPNNPTGNLFCRSAVEKIINLSTGLVVVDEAYSAFSGDSFIKDLARFENLLVMRTMSKFGLAGLRLGMLFGRGVWLEQLNKVRLPYNINVLTQSAAEFALSNMEVFNQQAKKICLERGKLFKALGTIGGVLAFRSEGNFILFKTLGVSGEMVFKKMQEEGVLIKNLSGSHSFLNDCLRVTVGTEVENNLFLRALVKVINN